MKAKPTFSLKDQLFNKAKVTWLAAQLKTAYPDFQVDSFIVAVVNAFPNLELKERIVHISEKLYEYLPHDYDQVVTIIVKALPAELDPNKTDGDFGDFIIAPLSHYIAKYGCKEEYLETSLMALQEITKRFSAEDAIRYFINAFPEKTLSFLHDCAQETNYHVRRLASEGTRPSLPWSQKLVIDYKEPVPLLDLLCTDNTRYVTRSVANHLNDISKIDPNFVIQTLQRWKKTTTQTPKEMHFIIKHSLRTLVKTGNPQALKLLGFSPSPDVSISNVHITSGSIKLGESVAFSFDLLAHTQEKLNVEYAMHYASKTGKRRKKVYKLKQFTTMASTTYNFTKKHPMRLVTTRALYAGKHTIVIQVNGKEMGQLSFELHM